MMNFIWNKISKQGWNSTQKQKLFLVCSILAFCVLGAMIWLLLGRLLLPDINWFICFVGYPGVFLGFFGGILFLWKNVD